MPDREIAMNEADKLRNPVKAIRAFCLNCCGESVSEVKLCPSTKCALYPFRFGKNPFRGKRVMSDEQRAKAAERLKAAREKKQTEV